MEAKPHGSLRWARGHGAQSVAIFARVSACSLSLQNVEPAAWQTCTKQDQVCCSTPRLPPPMCLHGYNTHVLTCGVRCH